MMKNILVTGAAGFIGSNFVHHLLAVDSDVRVVSLDIISYAGYRPNLDRVPDPARHDFVEGDICDRELVGRVMAGNEIEAVVHFAAESHVDRSIMSPDIIMHSNVVGTSRLLETARDYWFGGKGPGPDMARFHHISTDEVFGTLEPGDPAWTEASPYAPNSPYAASKASSDHIVRAFGTTYGLPYVITNCSNNYGPRQFPEKLIPLTVLNALEGRDIPVYGDGAQIRDWLYVGDHCEAIHSVLARGRTGETYLVGGENQTANIDLVTMICCILDELKPGNAPHSDLITFVEDRPGHDRRYDLDTAKIRRELGWEPGTALADGLRRTVRWYLDNPVWVKEQRAKSADIEGVWRKFHSFARYKT